MTTKELWDTLKFESAKIQSYREQIAKWRDGSMRASGVDCEPVQGGASSDKVSLAACEIVRLSGEMQMHINRLEGYLVYLDTPPQREVFRLRYIETFTGWTALARDMKYSVSHAKKLHGQALILIADKYQLTQKVLRDT